MRLVRPRYTRAGHDRIVEAEVLGAPHAVEAVLLGRVDDRQRVGEPAESTEGNAQPHRTLLATPTDGRYEV